MVGNFGWEFTGKRNLLPLFAVYFGAFLSIHIDCVVVHVVDAELPHITETAFLQVLPSIDVESNLNKIT